MYKTSTRTLFLTVLVAGVSVLSALALPASAASRTTTFCRDVEGVVVLSPGLPSNDSASAIASAVSKLPSDVTALKKIHAKLMSAVGAAPSSVLTDVIRVAANSVAKESSAITEVISVEPTVLSDPKNSSAVVDLAQDLIAATSAAATANAYLAVDHSTIAEVCKSAA